MILLTIEEYREKVNPCYGYDCYDPDLGCTMPADERSYLCPLEMDLLWDDFDSSRWTGWTEII